MKNRTTPTHREIELGTGDFIVSKTDTKGRITYANRIFMRTSGYREAELLDKQHNIVRHPDMPRTIFRILWDRVEQGDECFAYIKNLCKNGDHYWVLANVTPDYDQQGNISGYFSVRRKPRSRAIEYVSSLYAKMVDAERKVETKNQIPAGNAVLDLEITERGHENYETFILGL